MKYILVAALGTVLFGTAAVAQTAPTNASTTPPAIATQNTQSNTTAAPVPGENSFTETEVRSRLQKFGYTDVTDLTKDGNSIWRGQAVKDGRLGNVAVDYQGNITFR